LDVTANSRDIRKEITPDNAYGSDHMKTWTSADLQFTADILEVTTKNAAE